MSAVVACTSETCSAPVPVGQTVCSRCGTVQRQLGAQPRAGKVCRTPECAAILFADTDVCDLCGAWQGTVQRLREHQQRMAQPDPVPNEQVDIQTRVIEDVVARRAHGIQTYGTALQPFNGRDGLRDAYEEALDLVMYLRQLIEERDQAGGTRQ